MTPSHVNPALLTMIWILPPPNSAAFFTSSSMYCEFSMSPGIAIACPPASLITFATALALSIRSQILSVSDMPARISSVGEWLSTGVDILHNNLCALLGKEICCLSADSLTATSDYGDLACKHAFGVEMPGDLGNTICCHCFNRADDKLHYFANAGEQLTASTLKTSILSAEAANEPRHDAITPYPCCLKSARFAELKVARTTSMSKSLLLIPTQ